jgi:LysR family transcriptional regulator, nitrogen assimilation regulatory protein
MGAAKETQMEIRHLQYFMSVVRAGSLSRAAIESKVTQPALSRQMSLLEAEFGERLLVRTGRGILLTDAGRLFAKHGEKILKSVEELRSEMRSGLVEPTGDLAFGLPPSVGLSLGAQAVQTFHRKFPKVSLRVVEAYSSTVSDLLMSGRIDVAILYDVSANKSLETVALLEEELFLVSTPFDERELQSAYDSAALARVPLILPTAPNGLRILVDGFMRAGSEELLLVAEVDALEVQKELIKSGMGYGVLPYLAVQREVELGALRITPLLPALTRRMVCASVQQKAADPAVRGMMDCIEIEIDRIAASGMIRNLTRTHTE